MILCGLRLFIYNNNHFYTKQTALSLWPSLSMCNEYCIVWITTEDYFIAIVIRPDRGMAKQGLQCLILVAIHLLKGLGKLFTGTLYYQLALFCWLSIIYDLS